jgi:uncharacterized membrane protein
LRLKLPNGILIVDILSVLLTLSIVFFPSTVLRVVLGLPFLLFFPGYTLAAALFVVEDSMDAIQKLALSVGMSMAVVAAICFGLNYTPWGIRLEPVLLSVTGFILVTSAIALARRARVPGGAFSNEIALDLPAPGYSGLNVTLSVVLAVVMLGTLVTLGYALATPKVGEKSTDFYILGVNGKAQDYPAEFIMDRGKVTQVVYGDGTVATGSVSGSVTLAIVNREQQQLDYFVRMTVDGVPASIEFGGVAGGFLGPVRLQAGEKWENAIGIAPQHLGDNQKVELLLFKGIDARPQSSLHFWIMVKQAP